MFTVIENIFEGPSLPGAPWARWTLYIMMMNSPCRGVYLPPSPWSKSPQLKVRRRRRRERGAVGVGGSDRVEGKGLTDRGGRVWGRSIPPSD